MAHATNQVKIDIISVPEKLMMANATAFRQQLKSVIVTGTGKIILDLSETRVVDSSGLSVFVSAVKEASRKDGFVWLAGVNPEVMALLELTRLHTIFGIYDNVCLAEKAALLDQ